MVSEPERCNVGAMSRLTGLGSVAAAFAGHRPGVRPGCRTATRVAVPLRALSYPFPVVVTQNLGVSYCPPVPGPNQFLLPHSEAWADFGVTFPLRVTAVLRKSLINPHLRMC